MTTESTTTAIAPPPVDVHLSVLLAFLEGNSPSDKTREDYAEDAEIARQHVERADVEMVDWYEAIQNAFQQRPCSDQYQAPAIFRELMTKYSAAKHGQHPAVAVDVYEGFSMIQSLMGRSFTVGAAAMYLLLKGGAR